MRFRTSTTLRFAVLLMFVGGFLDAYTYITRGGVFANAQTGNAVLFGVAVAEGHVGPALAHIWPILACITGIFVAAALKSPGAERALRYPMRFAVVLQIAVLVIVGFLPPSVPDPWVTVTIAFVAALQLGLFREVASLPYITIAVTGNIMRAVESAYTAITGRDRVAGRTAALYGTLILTFVVGAATGAVLSRHFGTHTVWIAAAILGVALALFFIDDVLHRRRARRAAPTRHRTGLRASDRDG